MSADESDLSKLASSATLVFAGGFVAAGVKLLERVVIGRSLSVAAYGEVGVGIAVLAIGSRVALAGFQQGVPRYMSRFDDDRDRRGVWLTGLLVAAVGGLVVAGVLAIAGDAVVELLFEGDAADRLLMLFVLALPFNVGLSIGVGAIRGMENTIYKTYGRDLFYHGFRLSVLVALLALGTGVLAAGYAYLAASVAAFVLVHLLLRRLLPLVGGFELRFGEMAKFSAPLLLSAVVGTMLSRTDTLMLAALADSSEAVGYYTAAYPLATGMLVVLSSFGFMYLPVASRLDADDKREEVDAAYKVTTKWIYLVTFPIFLTLVAFPTDVLGAAFGDRYVAAAPALQILAVGFFTNAAAGRNRETLSAMGYTQYVLYVNVAALVVNVFLNLWLIPVWGYVGASVASAVSFGAFNLFVIVLLATKFDISPFSASATRAFVLLPVLLVPAAFLVSRHASLTLVTLPVFAAAAGVVTVYTAAVTGCLQPEDRVPLDLFEQYAGFTLPLVERFVPAEADAEA
jgi:O-antigen/teichoic acid export membrane protein